MLKNRIARRIAAAALAVALAVSGAAGLGAADDHRDTPGTEQAGGTWSLTDDGDVKGHGGNHGSTWS